MKQKKFKHKNIDSLLLYGRRLGESKAEIAVTSGLFDWIMYGSIKSTSVPRSNTPKYKGSIISEAVQSLIKQGNKNIRVTTQKEESQWVFTVNIDGQAYDLIEDSAKNISKLSSAAQKATSTWYRTAKSSKNYYVTIVNVSINYQKSKSFVPHGKKVEVSVPPPLIKKVVYLDVKKIERTANSNQITITGKQAGKTLAISLDINKLLGLTSLDKLFL